MKWISVKDKLPEEDSCVLITDGQFTAIQEFLDNGNGPKFDDVSYVEQALQLNNWEPATLGYCSSGSSTYIYHKDITHWMPFPDQEGNRWTINT